VERPRDERPEARPAPADGPFAELRYVVEAIRIQGNRTTHRSVIQRHLGIRVGDVIGAADPRVVRARLELLSTGLFRDVSFALAKGSRPGRVVLEVRISERGSLVLQALHFGFSDATPFWGGLEIAENNFLGRGLQLSGGFVIGGAHQEIGGSRIKHAERLRFAWPGLIAGRVGLSVLLLYAQASDYFRLGGSNPDGSDLESFAALAYQRAGGVIGAFLPVGARNFLGVDYRFEWIWARLPTGAVRTFPNGREERIDWALRRDVSYLSTVAVSFVRDTRNDATLPSSGMRLELLGEVGTSWMGSTYVFVKGQVSFAKFWPVTRHRHVIGLDLFGGVIIGEAPLFNRFHIGDLSEFLPNRALGLSFCTRPSRNLLGNRIAEMTYEDLAARVGVSYSIPLSRGGRYIHGSDLYASFGLLLLMSRQDMRIRDQGLWSAIPLDLTFDLGFRLDTYIGVLTLSFGNSLGWIPR
jgi:outer membrane protein assembly factor BamA